MVQLQRISPEHDDRFNVRVIGYLTGQSLLVTAPTVNGKVQIIRDGQRFVVRMLHGGDVQGFISTVIHSAAKPYPYLHLSYPSEIESIVVRNAERIDTNLRALARNTADPDSDMHWHPVRIKDLSITGARLESIDSLGQVDEKLELKFSIEVCDEAERMRLVVTIRGSNPPDNPAEASARFSTGIQFHLESRYQKLLFNNYVLCQKSQMT
jgi:c-di-GMP-binding flagellar brake protein YcgR